MRPAGGRRAVRRSARLGSRGIAALEFGLLSPLFLLLLAGVVDFANAYVAKSLLDATVSSAANYAVLNGGTQDGATLAANLARILANSNSVRWFNGVAVVNAGATATVTSGVVSSTGSINSNAYCPTGAPPALTWGSPATAGSACSGGGLAGGFVSIVASYVYVPIFAGFSYLPNGTMTSSAVVQTR